MADEMKLTKVKCINGHVHDTNDFIVEKVRMGLAVYCYLCGRVVPHEEYVEEPEAPYKEPEPEPTLHPDVEKAIEQIDAAIFSGDAGGPGGVMRLRLLCERWLRGLAELEQTFSEEEDNDDKE